MHDELAQGKGRAMRWQGERQSSNVEDRRSAGGPVMVGGGLMTLVVLLLVWFLGGDPIAFLKQMNQGGAGPGQVGPQNPGAKGGVDDAVSNERKQFVSVVLADTEDVWNAQFQQLRKPYREPKLVLFSNQVRSACGFADSAVGPFYCPADEQVYLDMAFFDELERRFKAPGDFAQAYVVAHEVGHHVQNLLGWSERVQAASRRSDKVEANKLSVRLELQADYLAGVWAHHAQRTKGILEAGDIEEGLGAAAAVGDDRLQKQTRGHVVPDSFTHGTSSQRVRWFRRGLETGSLKDALQLFEVDESSL
jgi:predicted metalloprotease